MTNSSSGAKFPVEVTETELAIDGATGEWCILHPAVTRTVPLMSHVPGLRPDSVIVKVPGPPLTKADVTRIRQWLSDAVQQATP